MKIWQDYSEGKQTYKQLANKYQCSIRTIQRYVLNAPKTILNPPKNNTLNLLIDSSFWGREFGVLVLMDSLSKKVVYHQIIKKRERCLLLHCHQQA